MKRVLVLAYKYPDLIVPGGSTRVEKFVRYLPRHGWQPVVLSVRLPAGAPLEPVHSGPYVERIPSHYGTFVKAYRNRHLSAKPSALVETVRRTKNLVLVPDDVVLWWPRAVPAALRLIRRHKPEAIFASGPPYSLLLLGALLKKLTRVPLVADLRDDWAGNPLAGKRNLAQALTERPLERAAVRAADRLVVVTQASFDLYRERYPRRAGRLRLVSNGFDEADFEGFAPWTKKPRWLDLLHVGSLKAGRSPRPVFEAMQSLADEDPVCRRIFFNLVGTHHAEHMLAATAVGLNDQVKWEERLPRADVVRRMEKCDALVLLPSQDAPTAIPGKVYEYLRAGRPLLVVSAPNETTRFLARFPGAAVHRPDDVAGIRATLRDWFFRADPPVPDASAVAPFARERLTGALAALLEEL